MDKYIKTGTTEFEQFDGSDEMIEKYGIRKNTEYKLSDDPLEYQTVPYQIETLEGWLSLNITDWIATGVEDEHWPVKDEAFKKKYEKVPVIKKHIANYLEKWKKCKTLFGVFVKADEAVSPNGNIHGQELEAYIYVMCEPEQFTRAWLDGYEVVGDSQ